jgi:hypothetical protein
MFLLALLSWAVLLIPPTPSAALADEAAQVTYAPDLIIVPRRTATPTRTPTPINLGNFVWDDLDKDGRQDAGEPGLPGVTVQLWNSAKTQLLASTVTNASGNYTVVAPIPGSYRIRVLLPDSDDIFSPKDLAGGDDTKDSDINPSGTNFGFTDTFTIASNVISITKIDAGIIVYRPPTPTRTPTPINLGNFVWDDLDKDGRQDAGEPGLPGVTVQLWNSAKTQLLDSDVTNGSGNYTVVAPLPGSYRIRVLLPDGDDIFSPKDQAGGDDTKDSDINPSGTNFGFTDTFTIASNVISITSLDAGIIVFRPPTPTRTPSPINIGNFVWNDRDKDGIQDAGEPGLAGVTVQLWNSTKTQLLASTVTNANGNYTVVAPKPGSYRLRVLLPGTNDRFSPMNQGDDDTKDSDFYTRGVDAGFTAVFTLASNLISTTIYDAGIIRSIIIIPKTATPTPTASLTPSLTPLPTLAGASNDTLALFGGQANRFSLVDTLQNNPSSASFVTFDSNAPTKGKFVMGDWDGDGQKSPGLFQNGNFWYSNAAGDGAPWFKVRIGDVGPVSAVAGRFNPAFTNDCFGIVQLQNVPQDHDFRLQYTCELNAENPPSGIKRRWIDVTLPGEGAYQFVAGDWDGDGLDSLGVRRANRFKWGNTAPALGALSFTSVQKLTNPQTAYGAALVGDWNGDGIDTIGLYFKGMGKFYWRNDLSTETAPFNSQIVGLPVNQAAAASWRRTNAFTLINGALPLRDGD